MRFVYQYRTSDNKQHTAEVSASSKDEAYAILRAKGIRPGRVFEASGLFNKLFGRCKRWIAIVLLSILAIALVVAFRMSERKVVALEKEQTEPTPRHQIYGDPALMERLEREGFSSVFTDEGDRYLAAYAQPGVRMGAKDDGKRSAVVKSLSAIAKGDGADILLDGADEREVRELKRIVLWMRTELREYLADGQGSVSSYMYRLDERLEREAVIYDMAKRELENTTDMEKWEARNQALKAVGLRTIPMPDSTAEKK